MWTDELKLTAQSYYLGVVGQPVILRWSPDENKDLCLPASSQGVSGTPVGQGRAWKITFFLQGRGNEKRRKW